MTQRPAGGYNPGVENPGLVLFDVAAQDEGGFSAYARVGTFSMLTQGETLDELRSLITDLIDDYNAIEPEQIESYALIFSAGHSDAAAPPMSYLSASA